MRERVQCLILKNKNILLVKDVFADHYYPPGGGLEEGETHLQNIQRELREELNIEVQKAVFYCSYEEVNVVRNIPQMEHNYFVEYKGEAVASSEVEKILWVSWDGIVSQQIPMPPNLYEKLLVKMHDEGYI